MNHSKAREETKTGRGRKGEEERRVRKSAEGFFPRLSHKHTSKAFDYHRSFPLSARSCLPLPDLRKKSRTIKTREVMKVHRMDRRTLKHLVLSDNGRTPV